MPSPSYDALLSLRAITEAAEGLIRAQTISIRERERALLALSDASSEPNQILLRFRQTSGEEAAPFDWKDAAVAAVLELESARILAAASVVIGEIDTPPGEAPITLLHDAIEEAKVDLYQVESVQAFRATPDRGEFSATIPDAIKNFKVAANQTIDSIVKESERAVSEFVAVIKAKGKDVLGAFDGFAPLLDLAPAVGLLKNAWEKLKSGLKLLVQILDALPVDEVRQKIQSVVNSVSIHHGIELLYQTGETRNIIEDLQFRADLLASDIDAQRDRLTTLADDFNQFVRSIIAISALASVITTFFAAQLTGPLAVLAIPSTHALASAAVLVVGIGLNDAWLTIRQIHGIRFIVRGVGNVLAESA